MICIVEAFNAKRRKERYCTVSILIFYSIAIAIIKFIPYFVSHLLALYLTSLMYNSPFYLLTLLY